MMAITAHALLRDRAHWLGSLRGLTVQADGTLSLARVPAPADGRAIDIPVTYPYARQASGLAAGPCDTLFVADTVHHRVLFVDGRCAAQAWLPARNDPALDAPGHFNTPRGLAVGADYLLVADAGHGALQQLAFPRLEAHRVWKAIGVPLSLAVDAQGKQLVVDEAAGRVVRSSADGRLDDAFNARLAQQTEMAKPFAVAVGANGEVFISDSVANAVFAFDAQGRFMHLLAGPAGWLPGALAAQDGRLFVADAATGAILVFAAGTLQGSVEGWRGPVSALAVGARGDLYVKPGLDASYHRFTADTAFVREAELLAGPFDAGELQVWERVWLDAQAPPDGLAAVDVALKSSADAPLASEWLRLPSADALLAAVAGTSARFVWLRLRLSSTTAHASPVVHQLRCATSAEDYLDYLPLTYRAHDGDEFLARWLKLLRGEFAAVEASIDSLPRLADADFVPPDFTRWLAQWFGLELPQIASDAQARALIAGAVQLFARRGTPQSIAQFVELHTGIRPAIVEAFEERRVWVLGVSSRLGFDTRLAPLDPAGAIVPDAALAAWPGPIGAVVIGASGPLAPYQIGLPLYTDEAYRFCVVVDGYRVRDPRLLGELRRIVDREKPAHTDYRVAVIEPDMRVGYQARIGIDAIVGGSPPAPLLDTSNLGVQTFLPHDEIGRVGTAALDGTMSLN